MKHKTIMPSAPQPVATDKLLIERAELQRATDSLREFTLTECERLAYIERYGAPTKPYRVSTAFVPNVPNNRRKGRGA